FPPRSGGLVTLKLVIPKGSLEEQTLRLLESADLRVRRGSSRDYHGRIEDERIERVSLLRPQEIPRYVEDGFFDVGITGRDWGEPARARDEGHRHAARVGGAPDREPPGGGRHGQAQGHGRHHDAAPRRPPSTGPRVDQAQRLRGAAQGAARRPSRDEGPDGL